MIWIIRPAESALEVGLAEFCGHGLPDQSDVYTDASDGNSMPASGRRFGVNAGSLDQSHVARAGSGVSEGEGSRWLSLPEQAYDV
jgi:hypothetical protein